MCLLRNQKFWLPSHCSTLIFCFPGVFWLHWCIAGGKARWEISASLFKRFDIAFCFICSHTSICVMLSFLTSYGMHIPLLVLVLVLVHSCARPWKQWDTKLRW